MAHESFHAKNLRVHSVMNMFLAILIDQLNLSFARSVSQSEILSISRSINAIQQSVQPSQITIRESEGGGGWREYVYMKACACACMCERKGGVYVRERGWGGG